MQKLGFLNLTKDRVEYLFTSNKICTLNLEKYAIEQNTKFGNNSIKYTMHRYITLERMLGKNTKSTSIIDQYFLTITVRRLKTVL